MLEANKIMNHNPYFHKWKIEKEMNKLIIDMLIEYNRYNGKICKKCGVVHGKPLKGFKKYYCEHLTKKIDRQFRKENEKISNKIVSNFLNNR